MKSRNLTNFGSPRMVAALIGRRRVMAPLRRFFSSSAAPIININPTRLMEDLHHLRSIGAAEPYVPEAKGGDGVKKGVIRPALTPQDVEARKWLMQRCEESGMETSMDRLGNTVCVGSGDDANPTRPRLLAGSHSDTQPTGGWLDGALGVVFAIEAARALKEHGLPQVLDVVNFNDEEGRFGSLVGSTSICGGNVDMGSVSSSPEGVAPRLTLGEEIRNRDLQDLPLFRLGDGPLKGPYFGYFEAHIEQGRRLERGNVDVAAVTGIVGLRQCRVLFSGESNHAGSTQMRDRRDAFQGAIQFAYKLSNIMGQKYGSTEAVWTMGKIEVSPGAASIIPSHADLTVQWRAATEERMDEMYLEVKRLVEAFRGDPEVPVDVELDAGDRLAVEAVHMDSHLVDIVRESAVHSGASCEDLFSGAIHDAGIIKKMGQIPSVMLFVPSIDGISHDFREDTKEEDIIKGAEVFARAAAAMIQQHPS